MNHFSDQGIILSVRPHGENGAVAHILSESHGKCGGYINGAQSSTKLRSLLQIGNHVSLSWTSKSEGQLGRFDLEPERDYASVVFDDPHAIQAMQSVCGLMDMFLPDREAYPALYAGTIALLDTMAGEEWPAVYILWEVAFLKEMGYGIDLSKCAVCGTQEGLTHISPKTGRAVCAEHAQPYIPKLHEIPRFMQGLDLDDGDYLKGLKMTEYFLVHRLLQHSSYQALPDVRSHLTAFFDDRGRT